MVALITEWLDRTGTIEKRTEKSDLGGTMRLGAQDARIKPGTLAHAMYGEDVISERHRHRYEVQQPLSAAARGRGLRLSARKSMDDLLSR